MCREVVMFGGFFYHGQGNCVGLKWRENDFVRSQVIYHSLWHKIVIRGEEIPHSYAVVHPRADKKEFSANSKGVMKDFTIRHGEKNWSKMDYSVISG